jgi:hypothetical protein
MNRPLALHLKAALLCALAAVALSLPLLWAPLVAGWSGWVSSTSPRVEAVLAVLAALWVAWCVVDIPRRDLKILIWLASLWLLLSGIWLAGLYGWPSGMLVPATAAALAGAGGLIFSFTPYGSRRVRWEKLVGPRVSRNVLKDRIDELDLEERPQEKLVHVAEVLWPAGTDEDRESWEAMTLQASDAARQFLQAGGFLERCDAEGMRVVFGCWGDDPEHDQVVQTLWQWVDRNGGTVALSRGSCLIGVGHLPIGPRLTLRGRTVRRVARLAATARGYGARLVVEETLAKTLPASWVTRRLSWWEFEGERSLVREVVGPADDLSPAESERLRRWDRAWEAFWQADWETAEGLFLGMAKESDDDVARIFALRSSAARRGGQIA